MAWVARHRRDVPRRRSRLLLPMLGTALCALVGTPVGAQAACTSGGLGLTAPSTLTFPSTTLSGNDQPISTTLALTGDDQSGTGTGWKLTGTSTTLTSGSDTLPTNATSVTAATRTAGTGNCSLPANGTTYPVTLPAGATAPPAAKLFSAVAGSYSGTGAINTSLTINLAIPANAVVGTYTSTWTLTLVTGP